MEKPCYRAKMFILNGGSFTGPGGNHSNVEFMIWVSGKWREFAEITGIDLDCHHSQETHDLFDKFLMDSYEQKHTEKQEKAK